MLKKSTLLALCGVMLLAGMAYCGFSNPAPLMYLVFIGLPLVCAGWALVVGE